MSTKTKIALLSVAGLTVLLTVGAYAWAKATETPVEGTYGAMITEFPERQWVDDEGVTHTRGGPFEMFSTGGDVHSTGMAVGNSNLDADGNGDIRGTTTWDLTWGDLHGTFEGRYSGTVTNWVADATGVYQGTGGDFVGMKLIITFDFDYATFTGSYQGIILDPHGE